MVTEDTMIRDKTNTIKATTDTTKVTTTTTRTTCTVTREMVIRTRVMAITTSMDTTRKSSMVDISNTMRNSSVKTQQPQIHTVMHAPLHAPTTTPALQESCALVIEDTGTYDT